MGKQAHEGGIVEGVRLFALGGAKVALLKTSLVDPFIDSGEKKKADKRRKGSNTENERLQMDRKKIGFGENGGESSSLMENQAEQCCKQLNHSFSASFFCLLVCLGAAFLLHPYSIHRSFFDFHSQSPCFSPDGRDGTRRE